jgi:hypothetical protein
MIYKIEQFVDDDGRQILLKVPQQKLKPTDGDFPKSIYVGTFSVTVPTPYGPQEAQISFDFPNSYDLDECFDKFDKMAEEEYERLIKEAREKSIESRIITPDRAGGIVMP